MGTYIVSRANFTLPSPVAQMTSKSDEHSYVLLDEHSYVLLDPHIRSHMTSSFLQTKSLQLLQPYSG